jgi:hypothetical protein
MRVLKWVVPLLAVGLTVATLRKELPAMRRYLTIERM